MSTAGNRSSSSCHISSRPPISFSSYCISNSSGVMQRSLDESRLIQKRTIEFYHDSTPSATGHNSFHSLSNQSPSSANAHRRKVNNSISPSHMTSFSALKRKSQRSDFSSNLNRFQVNLEHVLGFTSISNSVVSQDSSILAYAAGSTIVLYDIQTQKQDFIINNVRKSITSLSLSPDGRYIATGESGHDPKVRVWDLVSDKTTCIELGDHKYAIDCVCFSPNVDRLVSIGSIHDGNIYVWNWKDRNKLASNKCTCSIRRVAFSEDGSYFVTVGNRHVKFWYLVPTTQMEVVPLRGRYAILAERKDNLFTDVVCGRGDCAGMTYVITSSGLICQFDENRQMQIERDLQEKTNCLAIGDLYLVVGCIKGSVYIFTPQSLDFVMSIPLPHSLGVDIASITSVEQVKYISQSNPAFPDTIALCLDEDNSLLTCFYNDHSFYVWDLRNSRSVEKRDSHLYHSGCGWSIETYSGSNGTSLALKSLSFVTCSSDNTIRFWSLNSNTSMVNSLSEVSNIFSRQLTKILYLDEDHSKLCDTQTVQERPEFIPKVGGRCMRISPDGLCMAIGDRSGNVRIITIDGFKQTIILEAHDSEVLSVDYGRSTAMDLTLLASCSRDRFIHVFDVHKDYQLLATLDDHSGAITAVRFVTSMATTHLQLISCSADKSLIFRSLIKNDNGKYQFNRSNNIVEKQTFYDLTVDTKRDSVSTACQDRMIRIYNLQDGKRLRTCKGSMNDDTGYLIKIDIDGEGRFLATSCSNKCVYIWDINTSECLATLSGHGEIVTDLKFSCNGSHLYTISGDSCIFVWNISDLVMNSNMAPVQKLSDIRSEDIEESVIDNSISCTPSIIEEHQPYVKRQRSLWATSEPNLPTFDENLIRMSLPDVVTEDHCCPMTHSNSSQDEESMCLCEDNNEPLFTATNQNDDQRHSFLTENYDHENLMINHQSQSRTSVSARFRSVSKGITDPNRLSNSVNSTLDDISIINSNSTSINNHQATKYSKVQVSLLTKDSIESKPRAMKSSITRAARGNRARSEDRVRGSSLSLSNNLIDTAVHSQLPSYAAHTSSSMNKLRDNTVQPIPTASSMTNPLPQSSSSSSTMSINSPNPARPLPSSGPNLNARSLSLSRKNMPKSNSTQNLIQSAGIANQNKQSSKLLSHGRYKFSQLPKRPPHLPIKSTLIHSSSFSSTSSSSASSNSSSPIKTLPLVQEATPIVEPGQTNSVAPDQNNDDLMPKWAQDCFYRTVVLGLKPLLLQDTPSSPINAVPSSMISTSAESSESLEIISEIQLCTRDKLTNEIQIRQSLSVIDHQEVPPTEVHHLEEKCVFKEPKPVIEDQRIPIVDGLASDLEKRLQELEKLYSTILFSSDHEDLILKKYIEQIFINLQNRLMNNQRQENILSTHVNIPQ